MATVPILMLPLGVTEVVIDIILLNFFVPSAVLLAVLPVICSVIIVPLELVPVTVNVFLLSSAEEKMVTTAFKSLASFNAPSSV